MNKSIDRRLVMLGPPGAGKGTQAKLISEKLDIPHIDAGDSLRGEMEKGSDLGKQAKEYIDEGKLVPDELVSGIIKERIEEAGNGFVLDGYPRNLNQAEILSEFTNVDFVINVDLDKEVGVKRLSSRRICEDCGRTYNLLFNPPNKEGICDKCGGSLYQRSDDKAEVIENRFDVYREKTAPLKKYYQEKGKLKEVDGNRGIEEINQDIMEIID